MPIEIVNLIAQCGFGAIFFWLFWEQRKRSQEQDDKYEKRIAGLYTLWLNDIKYIAKLPTDLDGDYKLGPDSPVKA
jgi:hypothetical protein